MNLNRIYTGSLSARIALLVAAGIVVFLLLYYFDISSLNTDLLKAQQEEESLKEQLNTIINKEVLDQKEIAQFASIETLLSEWQKKLISYSQLPQLIDKILKMGTSSHVDFQLFSPAPPVKEDVYFKVPIKIIAVGDYNGLANLLSQIASLPSIAVINNFSITNGTKTSNLDPGSANAANNQLLTLDMTLEVYYIGKK